MTSHENRLADGSQIQHYVINSFYYESAAALFYRVYNQIDGQYYLLRSIKPVNEQKTPSSAKTTYLQDIEQEWQQLSHPLALSILATIESEKGNFQLFNDISLVDSHNLSKNRKDEWCTELFKLTYAISVLTDNLPHEQINLDEQLILDEYGHWHLLPSPVIVTVENTSIVKQLNKKISQRIIHLITGEALLVNANEPLNLAYNSLHTQWCKIAPKNIDQKIEELLFRGLLGDSKILILPQIQSLITPSKEKSVKRMVATGVIFLSIALTLFFGYYATIKKTDHNPVWHQAQLVKAIELQKNIKSMFINIQRQLKINGSSTFTIGLLSRLSMEQTLANAKIIKQNADRDVIAQKMEDGIKQYQQAKKELNKLINELVAIKQIEDLHNNQYLPEKMIQTQDHLWQPIFIQRLYTKVNSGWKTLENTNKYSQWIREYQEDVKRLYESISITKALAIRFEEASQVVEDIAPIVQELPEKTIKNIITSNDITNFQFHAKQSKSVGDIATVLQELESKLNYTITLNKSIIDYQNNAQLLQASMKRRQLNYQQLNVKVTDTLSSKLNVISNMKADGKLSAAIKEQQLLLNTLSYIDRQVQSIKLIQSQLPPLFSKLDQWLQKGASRTTIEAHKISHTKIKTLIKQGKLTQANKQIATLQSELTKTINANSNAYNQYKSAHMQWKLQVEQAKLEVDKAKESLADARDELDDIGSKQDCSKSFWKSVAEGLDFANCDLSCTTTQYVNGISYQSVDQFCKSSCVNNANQQANSDKKRRDSCNKTNSEIRRTKYQLNESISEYKQDYNSRKKRYNTMLNREPRWPS